MKIFQLIACLSKEELKLLRKAVLSPLYNTNKKTIALFEILRPLHPNFDDSLKGRQKIFKKLFPKVAYNDYKLRKQFTELTKIIEHFLLYLEQEAQPFERQKRLTRIYSQRNLAIQFKKNMVNLEAQLGQAATEGAEISFSKLEVLEMKYLHPLHDKYDLADQTLQLANEQLDSFYALKKYRLTLALKGRVQTLQAQQSFELLEAVHKTLTTNPVKDYPLLHLYRQVSDLSLPNRDIKFEDFKQSFLTNYTRFNFLDQQFLYFSGTNFLLKEYNTVTPSIKYELLDWYKFGLQTNIIFEQEHLSENVFANIIIIGCKANQFTWVETFMNTYYTSLATTDPKMTLLYYKGVFYYLQKAYDQALSLLMNSDKKSIYPPRLRTILARILYEKFLEDTSYFDTLMANLTAYDHFLKRNKIIALNKLQAHQNFIKVLRYFAKQTIAFEKKETLKQWFDQFIEQGNPLLAKAWFKEKLK